MNNLSPAAAVMIAYWKGQEASQQLGVAAALRAAADQVVPDKCPPIEDFNEFDQGYAVAHITHRTQLLAIAAELEVQ